MKISCYRCQREASTDLIHNQGDPMQQMLRLSLPFDIAEDHELVFFDDDYGAAESLETYSDSPPVEIDAHIVFIEATRAPFNFIGAISLAEQIKTKLGNVIPVVLIHNTFAGAGGRGLSRPYPEGPQELKDECDRLGIEYVSYNNDGMKDFQLWWKFPQLVNRAIGDGDDNRL
mgnify:CR=1 FL=1